MQLHEWEQAENGETMANHSKALVQSSFATDLTAKTGISELEMLSEPTKRWEMVWIDDSLTEKSTNQLVLDIYSYPSVKIFEIPSFETRAVKMMDKPPLPPEVKITPYAGINNTYLVSLDAAGGGEEEKIVGNIISGIAINPEDTSYFQELLENQHPGFTVPGFEEAPSEEGEASQALGDLMAQFIPLKFRGDDVPDFFEVFSIGPDPETGVAKPPMSYADFAKAKKIVLDMDGEASMSFRPVVEPNKKYYYTFRTVDIHGNLSYPSPVYEVKLVDDGGAVYLTVDIYEFPTVAQLREPLKSSKKGMRKFLNITPALRHSMHMQPEEQLNTYKQTGTAQPPFLGTGAGPSLFNNDKRYKIRLTSKNSGKKLDVNVKFKMTRQKTRHD